MTNRKEYMKKYQQEHKEAFRIATQKYRDKNRKQYNEHSNEYRKRKRKEAKENAELVIKYKIVLDKIKNNNKRIIDYGFDYDGFNNVEDLKKLIDMLVDYARKDYELLEEIE